MIVVDSSALVSIAAREADWMEHLAAIRTTDNAMIAAINYVEVGILLVRRGYLESQTALDRWLVEIDIRVVDDAPLSKPALAAYLRYRKGVHPAGLNLADCFAYALAKRLDAPLLYKGDDFSRTDIRSALQPT